MPEGILNTILNFNCILLFSNTVDFIRSAFNKLFRRVVINTFEITNINEKIDNLISFGNPYHRYKYFATFERGYFSCANLTILFFIINFQQHNSHEHMNNEPLY